MLPILPQKCEDKYIIYNRTQFMEYQYQYKAYTLQYSVARNKLPHTKKVSYAVLTFCYIFKSHVKLISIYFFFSIVAA